MEQLLLSPHQNRIRHLQAFGFNLYEQWQVRLQGFRDETSIMDCLRRIADQHEILRTYDDGSENKGVTEGVVAQAGTFSCRFSDISADPPAARSAYIKSISQSGLKDGKRVAFHLMKTSPGTYLLLISASALHLDANSLGLILNEISNGNRGNQPAHDSVSFADFVIWQNQLFHHPDKEARQFWQEYDFSHFRGIKLPFEKKPTGRQKPLFHRLSVTLGEESHQLLTDTAERLSLDKSVMLMAFLGVWMFRHTHQEEIVIGEILTDRIFDELSLTLGPLVKTAPVAFKINESTLPGQLFRQIEAVKEDLIAFKDSFVLDHAQVPGSEGPTCFPVLMEYRQERERWEGAGGEYLEVIESLSYNEVYKLKLLCREGKEYTRLDFYYDGQYFEESSIGLLSTQYEAILDSMLTRPQHSIADSNPLSKPETEMILHTFNRLPFYPERLPWLTDLLEAQVRANPASTAVIYQGKHYTYQHIHEQADRLANYLMNICQVRPGELVGLWLPRSEKVIIALLGILKAGAAFLPLDRQYPRERIKQICARSGLRLLLTESEQLLETSDFYTGDLVALDVQLEEFPQPGTDWKPARETSLAYVLYTSGSTGQPKGVAVPASALANYLLWANEYYFDGQQGFPFAFFTPLSFDLTLTSIFTTLTRGDAVFVYEEAETETILLDAFAKNTAVKAVKITPSHVTLLSYSDIRQTHLTHVILGGEAVSTKQVAFLRQLNPTIRVFNEYGPTEATIGCTATEITDSPGEVTIGKPIDRAGIFVVDQQVRHVPIGETGEIGIIGSVLAEGYLNDVENTASSFRRYSSPGYNGGIYLTGDLGRWLPNGELEFLGRKDDQVKIRGHRIELGEIKTTLLQHPDVKEAEVITSSNESEGLFLVAHLVAGDAGRAIDMPALRAFLRTRLPGFMIPAYFIQEEKFRLTKNGKVDRSALKDVSEWELSAGGEQLPPRNETEKQLVEIWEEVLGRKGIGIRDNFFEIGGHSLLAARLVANIQKVLGKTVDLGMFFKYQTIENLAPLIGDFEQGAFTGIKPIEEQEYYRVSSAQRRLWVLHQFEKEQLAYNIHSAFLFEGDLDCAILGLAFAGLVERHESLRTVFFLMDGELRQKVQSSQSSPFALRYTDLRGEANPEETADRLAHQEEGTGFNLEKGPLVRAHLLHLADERFLFLFTIHHTVTDWLSLKVLVNDVIAYYNTLAGEPQQLDALRIQYKDFTAWQDRLSRSEAFKKSQDYWRNQFAAEVPVLTMPTSFPRPPLQTFHGAHQEISFGGELLNKLNKYGQLHEGSLFMTLIAAINVLLYKYTRQTDIIIGTPISGRKHVDLDDQIGVYFNVLPLRTRFNPLESFDQLQQKVKEITLNAYENDIYPFDQLLDDLSLSRDLSRSPLFDVLVILLNADGTRGGKGEMKGIRINDYHTENNISKYDLEFTFTEMEQDLVCTIQYNTALFFPVFVEKLSGHLQQLVISMLENSQASLQELSYVSGAETMSLLKLGNSGAEAFPNHLLIHELFEAQVEKTPDAVAIQWENLSITYRELDSRSNYLRDRLWGSGVSADDRVGLFMDRTPAMIVGMLGVLKSGAAYLPVEPDFPVARQQYMLTDSHVKCLVSERALREQIPRLPVPIIFLDDEGSELPESTGKPVNISPENAAYVLYTSGSTGQPKGVVVPHRAVVNFLTGMKKEVGIHKTDKLLALTTYSFDISILELLLPLCNGAVVVLATKEMSRQPASIQACIRAEEITLVQATPSLWSLLLNVDWEEKKPFKVLCGGERLSQELGVKLLQKSGALFNLYGPTETTIWSSVKQIVREEDWGSIGRPLINTQFYILDENLRPVPVGVPGELYIGGQGVALGYLNRPELTDRSFLHLPLSGSPRGKIYRTGDLARWLPNGETEWLGRLDHQVKVRGYRVEVGEIENVLGLYPGLQEVTITCHTHQGAQALVAYFTSQHPPKLTELRAYLLERLPAYMVPSYFIRLPAFPLTPNGKVNRQQLPPPEEMQVEEKGPYALPRGLTEELIWQAFKKILNRDQVSVYDNFFEIGGHSLKAIVLLSDLYKVLHVKIELKDIFQNPTVSQLARKAAKLKNVRYENIQAIEEQEYYRVSQAQKRLWILDKLNPGLVAYNMPHAHEIKGLIDRDALEKAWTWVVKRHEVLRTIFISRAEEPYQWISQNESTHPPLQYSDFRNRSDRNSRLEELVRQEAHRKFELEKGPLLLGHLAQLEEDKYVLMVNMHHIVSDAWSMEVFFKDLSSYYQSVAHGVELRLIPLTIQQKDFASWQNNQLTSEAFTGVKKYWLEQFSHLPEVLDLPLDHPRSEHHSFSGGKIKYIFDASLYEGLNKASLACGATLFTSLVTCIRMLMYRISGRKDIVIGSTFSGRNHVELENQMGFYINTLPLRNKLEETDCFETLVKREQNVVLKALENQLYSFDALITDLRIKREVSRSPLFDVLVELVHIQPVADDTVVPHITVKNLDTGFSISQYDLSFRFFQDEALVELFVEYNRNLFEEETITVLLEKLLKVLMTAATETRMIIEDIPLTDQGSDTESNQIVINQAFDFNF